jgi:GTP:adenosylcobinamide-phosphate guanylyltransferase
MDAIVMAGGRVSGAFAEAIGTPVKALSDVAGITCVRRVIDALAGAPAIERICVVGPEEVRPLVPDACLWQLETPTALHNVIAGFDRLGATGETQVLVQGADVPALSPGAVQDLLERTPPDAELALPVVPAARFQERFLSSKNTYVHLAEGAFTGGSQYVMQPGALLRNKELLDRLHQNRKSQIGMVLALGLPFFWRLLTRRLTIPELEQRTGQLTASRCRAVPDCHPDLAYDIDSLEDLQYIRRWFRRQGDI